MNNNQQALDQHKKLKGKIEITAKDVVDSKEKLSIYYTPGVAAVSTHVANNPDQTRDYTWTGNTVAIISDGSAVLGLGNIGPEGALPVLEGKSMLFKSLAGVDAIPIILNVHSADEIVAAIKAIAPTFGGIVLEDIAAPICFEVEDRLKAELDIPVMHDDQHATAVVTLAGLINAAKVTGLNLDGSTAVIAGAGAAGVAVAKLLLSYADIEVIVTDSKGVLSKDRDDMNTTKQELVKLTNKKNISGSLKDALRGADIFIGLSQPNIVDKDMVKSMNDNPIIFAMANPEPEIMPNEAYDAGAGVVATGRSDFANQINNVLAFPGIFRGALDNRLSEITETHKLNAAKAVAGLITNPTKNNIIPKPLDKALHKAVAQAIVQED